MRIEIHAVDDWEALYIDGKLHSQRHSHQLECFMLHDAEYPLTIESLDNFYWDDDEPIGKLVVDQGEFPDTLEELVAIHDYR